MLTDDAMQFDRVTEERRAAVKPGAPAEGAAMAQLRAREGRS
jgi:hypothetical protein